LAEQWVIEDSFCNGRPPLEEVGVRFVDDVTPYETVKTRLLNAGHSAIAYLGYLAGYRTTADVVDDPVFRTFLQRLMAEEIAPSLPEPPGVDLADYQATLLDRLANPRMADQLARLGRRGSSKIPNYLLPSVRAAIEDGRPHDLLCLAVAGWLRYLRGQDYAGEEVPILGPRPDLVPLAQEAGADAAPLLSERSVFDHIGQEPAFAVCVQKGPHRARASGAARGHQAVPRRGRASMTGDSSPGLDPAAVTTLSATPTAGCSPPRNRHTPRRPTSRTGS